MPEVIPNGERSEPAICTGGLDMRRSEYPPLGDYHGGVKGEREDREGKIAAGAIVEITGLDEV